MYLANKKALKAKVAKTVRCFDKQEDAAVKIQYILIGLD